MNKAFLAGAGLIAVMTAFNALAANTGNAILESNIITIADKVVINDGKFIISGARKLNSNGGSWVESSMIHGNESVNLNGGEIIVKSKGIISVDFKEGNTANQQLNINTGAKVTLETDGVILASFKDDKTYSSFNINGGELEATGGTISAHQSNLNSGKVSILGSVTLINDMSTPVPGALNMKGGTLDNNGNLSAKLTQTGGVINSAKNSTFSSLTMQGGTFNVNGNTTITTASVISGGTMNLGTNRLKISKGLTLGDKGILNTTIANAADGTTIINGTVAGKLTGQDAQGNVTTAKVNFIVANGTNLSKATTIIISTDLKSKFTLADNMMYDFVRNADGISYTAQRADTTSKLASWGVGNQSATILSTYANLAALGGNTGTTIDNSLAEAFANDLQIADGAGVAHAVQQAVNLAPQSASVANNLATENTTQVMSVVNSELMGYDMASGQSSGDVFKRVNVWAKGMFNKADLDGNAGFKADTEGVAMGVDKQINDSGKVGIGYALASTDIKSTAKKTQVETHTAVLYGQYKPSNVYLNGVATYSWSDYDTNSSVYGHGINSKYDVNTFGLQAIAGYDFGVLAPEAGLRYFNVQQNARQDNAGQTVGKNSSDILTAVVGIRYQNIFCLENGMHLNPSIRLGATYDLKSDDANSVVSLADGSTYMVDGERLDRFGLEVGAGFAVEINDHVEFGVNYEGKFKKDYTDNTGFLNAKYKF